MSLRTDLPITVIIMSMLVFGMSSGRADTVVLKDATVKEGKIVSEDIKEVVLEMIVRETKAQIHIPKADVERIERTQGDKGALQEQAKPPKGAEPADPMRENEQLAKELAEYYTKARKNGPSNFEHDCDAVPDDKGIVHFRDKGRRWRARTDLCVSYCEKVMDAGRKRIALLQRFPDNPQFQKDIGSTKGTMAQTNALETWALSNRERRGLVPKR